MKIDDAAQGSKFQIQIWKHEVASNEGGCQYLVDEG